MLKSGKFRGALAGLILGFAGLVAPNSLLSDGESAPEIAPDIARELGREALADELAAWDQDVRPDGLGLPEGSGDVLSGEEVYVEHCAACHGDFGEGAGRWPVLAGGQGTLTSEDPEKTIGSYWPYLSTVWDYINEAMPFGDARSLSNDDIYAITAYLLYMNDIVVDEDFVLSNENFGDISLPNEAGFYFDDRDLAEYPRFSVRCMENCRDTEIQIVARASDIDVTPQTDGEATVQEEMEKIAERNVRTLSPDALALGEKAFKRCKACHAVGKNAKNGSGPHLNGLLGRQMGSVDKFRYSSQFQGFAEEGRVWNAENLSKFLSKPKAFAPKTRMAFSGLLKEEEIDALIVYLSQF